MPELPDVETFRRYVNATSLHQEIADVEVRSPPLLEEIQADELRQKLKSHTFASTDRHGKWLFLALDRNGWLALHFGMSGHLAYFKRMEKDPSYDRLLITFDNDYHLAYDAARKLGEIRVVPNPSALIEEKELGPDVLDADFDLDRFRAILAERRGMIKPALMDQGLMAGIGNVYSDEILFQARIHPRTQISQLSAETIAQIYRKMQSVLDVAIEHQAKPEEFPDHYIIPHRHSEGKCPVCGGEVSKVTVSGRTAYYCPSCQESEV